MSKLSASETIQGTGQKCSCPEAAVISDDFVLSGLDCADCAAKLEKVIANMEGVTRSAINFATARLKVEYHPAKVHRRDIAEIIEKMGYSIVSPADKRGKESVLRLSGLDCADCAAKLQKAVENMPGVQSAKLNFGAAVLHVEHTVDIEAVIKTVRRLGYQAAVEGSSLVGQSSFWLQNRRAITTAASGIFVAAGVLGRWLGASDNLVTALFSIAILAGGYLPGKAGFNALTRGFTMDMNVLMIAAVVGAAAINQWEEAATVIFLFSLGSTLESYSMEKTRSSIRALMDLAPDTALVRRGGKEQTLPAAEILVGDIVIVRPGERIPMDGKVIAGHSTVNQAPITGESMPVEKEAGAEVYAGTINGSSALEIQVTKLVEDNTIARIIKMVEKAQEQKAPSQRFIDVFARYYTPAVIILAAILAAVPPLLFNQPFSPWFYRALTLLVVSCPCALVISTPVSVVSAIGSAARQGILIKGGAYLEQAGSIKAVAFDKTGTLTLGKPVVTDIIPQPTVTAEQVLLTAAAIEVRSEHPMAIAVLEEAKQRNLHYSAGEHFVALTGKGAKAKIAGQNYYIGSPKLFSEDLQLDLSGVRNDLAELQSAGKTAVLVGTKSKLLGILALADKLRPTGAEAIALLKKRGIKTIMLTGDNQGTAEAIGKQIGIDEIKSNLLPQHKAAAVKSLQKKYRTVAMVGDGVNDAPALAAANIGMAMGGAGTDVALETADIALMSDDPAKVADVIKLSQRALVIIKQNIAFALIVKLAAVVLVFPGILNLWMAIMADTGAALVVIANGMRLLRSR